MKSYYVETVRCENCGNDKSEIDRYNYSVQVHKLGRADRCDICRHSSYPYKEDFDFWFCCRKCLLEFMEKHTNEKYIHKWE